MRCDRLKHEKIYVTKAILRQVPRQQCTQVKPFIHTCKKLACKNFATSFLLFTATRQVKTRSCKRFSTRHSCKFFACESFCLLCISIETISHVWSFVYRYNKTWVNSPRVVDWTIQHANTKKLQPDPVGLKLFCNCESSPVAWRKTKMRKLQNFCMQVFCMCG